MVPRIRQPPRVDVLLLGHRLALLRTSSSVACGARPQTADSAMRRMEKPTDREMDRAVRRLTKAGAGGSVDSLDFGATDLKFEPTRDRKVKVKTYAQPASQPAHCRPAKSTHKAHGRRVKESQPKESW